MKIEAKLKAMGLELPEIQPAVASYIPFVRVGELLFLAGTVGERSGKPPFVGKVGAEVTLEQAKQAARQCGLNHLAMMKAALGDLDRVERIVRLIGYVNSAAGFQQQPWVINGESDLYIALWGEKGRHARAALGISELALNAPVETEVIVQVRPERPRAATVVRATKRLRNAVAAAAAARPPRRQAAARRRRA